MTTEAGRALSAALSRPRLIDGIQWQASFDERDAAAFLAALAADGWGLIETERLVNLTNALLHLAARRHEHSNGCDGCLNIQAVLKELVGLPDPVPS